MSQKIKIVRAGQPCRKCGTPVVRREHAPNAQGYKKKAYWFEWWFACPRCRTLFMVEAAKRFKGTEPQTITTSPQLELEL